MPTDLPPEDDFLEEARARLKRPEVKERHWAALAAAAFFAIAAIGFAVAAILAPANTVDPAAKHGVGLVLK